MSRYRIELPSRYREYEACQLLYVKYEIALRGCLLLGVYPSKLADKE